MPSAKQSPRATTLDSWAAEANAAHLQCRDTGHSWVPFRASIFTNPRGKVVGYEQHLQCTRCSGTKKRELDSAGYVVRSNYSYADDYLAPRGLDTTTSFGRATLRLASLNRSPDGVPLGVTPAAKGD